MKKQLKKLKQAKRELNNIIGIFYDEDYDIMDDNKSIFVSVPNKYYKYKIEDMINENEAFKDFTIYLNYNYEE